MRPSSGQRRAITAIVGAAGIVSIGVAVPRTVHALPPGSIISIGPGVFHPPGGVGVISAGNVGTVFSLPRLDGDIALYGVAANLKLGTAADDPLGTKFGGLLSSLDTTFNHDRTSVDAVLQPMQVGLSFLSTAEQQSKLLDFVPKLGTVGLAPRLAAVNTGLDSFKKAGVLGSNLDGVLQMFTTLKSFGQLDEVTTGAVADIVNDLKATDDARHTPAPASLLQTNLSHILKQDNVLTFGTDGQTIDVAAVGDGVITRTPKAGSIAPATGPLPLPTPLQLADSLGALKLPAMSTGITLSPSPVLVTADGGTQVVHPALHIPAGALPDNTSIGLFHLDPGKVNDVRHPQGTSTFKVVDVFDVSLSGGTPSQPITLSLQDPLAKTGQKVYKVKDDGSLQELTDVTVSNGSWSVSFKDDPGFVLAEAAATSGGGSATGSGISTTGPVASVPSTLPSTGSSSVAAPESAGSSFVSSAASSGTSMHLPTTGGAPPAITDLGIPAALGALGALWLLVAGRIRRIAAKAPARARRAPPRRR